MAGPPALVQSPFDGTWQMNQEKSDLTSSMMPLKIEDAGGGAIRIDKDTLKTDGSKTATADGGQSAIEKRSARNYHETDWFKGVEAGQSDFVISHDGKTLTIHSHGTNPNGAQFDTTTTYTRIARGDGLVGVWKPTSIKDTQPRIWIVKVTDSEVLWNEPGVKITVRASTDGKPVSPKGPMVPESMTMAFTKEGPRTLHMVEQTKGKTVFTVTYAVSEDGKTLTVDGKTDKGESVKEVWEKQR